jgi:hypothetical protein
MATSNPMVGQVQFDPGNTVPAPAGNPGPLVQDNPMTRAMGKGPQPGQLQIEGPNRPRDFYEEKGIFNPYGRDPEYYREQLGEWYDQGITEEGLLDPRLAYDPTLIDPDELQMLDPYNFDPIRRQAMGELQARQRSGYETALTGQAASTGLTAADRMALASSFNRGRLGATSGLLADVGVAEAENVWETDRSNKELLNKIYGQNVSLQNEAQARNIQALDAERRRQYEILRDLRREDIERGKFEGGVVGAEEQAAAMEKEAERKPGILEDPIGYVGDIFGF